MQTKKGKNAMMIMGVAFVWFSTHFGGGFASGAQIYSYFVKYGIWSLFMPILAMLYNAVFFAYSLRFARKHQVYDYRSYNNAFYGKFAPIFSNLFELLYLCVMCIAPAVAFATGGATLSELTGLPYLLCTLLIGAVIFVISIFGTDLVRKVAWVVSICIILGLLAVYLPNIFTQLPEISRSLSVMQETGGSFTDALYSAFLYGTFQLCNIAVFVQHAKSFDSPNDDVKSLGVGFVVNGLMMLMVVVGLITVYTNPEAATQSVPTLFMVKNGVGAQFMLPLISVLILLGAVSTAVNMVAAMVKRLCSYNRPKEAPDAGEPSKAPSFFNRPLGKFRVTGKEILAALLCCLIDFSVAQFGLLNLIQKAYSFLAYLAIPVILIPYIIHAVFTRLDTKSSGKDPS